jgi:predicted phosphoribosyltransferase
VTFADRAEAGRALARRVAALSLEGRRPLVLALPRGGVPVAVPVAAETGGELDVVIARKIGAPGQPELGIGALAEDGPPLVDRAAMAHLGVTDDDLAPVVERERAELARRTRLYRGDRPAPRVAGRAVVVVDDGLATGVTAVAALRWVRAGGPSRLVMAVPVGSRPGCAAVARVADDVVCLRTPRRFRAVGRWYHDFSQLTDADVVRALAG